MQSPSDSAGSADSVCAICLEGFVDFEPSGRETMHLECLHRFHADCIRKWIDTKPSCPVCKCSTQHDGTGRSITTEFLLGSRSQFPQFPRTNRRDTVALRPSSVWSHPRLCVCGRKCGAPRSVTSLMVNGARGRRGSERRIEPPGARTTSTSAFAPPCRRTSRAPLLPPPPPPSPRPQFLSPNQQLTS